MLTPTKAPLAGISVIEFAGMGPVPFCGMMLADFGASVMRIDRPGTGAAASKEVRARGKQSLELNLKGADDRARLMKLVSKADVVLEGYRPGVMERLGLGPDDLMKVNPGLVYARSTGWGQTGPLANEAGHDLNYLALTGVLAQIGGKDTGPVIPLNLLGDYAGGGTYMAFGILAALLGRNSGGGGQVIDAAMIDGIGHLATIFHNHTQIGRHTEQRGTNMLDGGAPFYTTYETRDGRYVAVGCIEEKFYNSFVEAIGVDIATLPDRDVKDNWPAIKAAFSKRLGELSSDEIVALTEGKDCCVTPVLSLEEARAHPHARAREAFALLGDTILPQPAPRLWSIKEQSS